VRDVFFFAWCVLAVDLLLDFFAGLARFFSFVLFVILQVLP
jgi:hypothetical protein